MTDISTTELVYALAGMAIAYLVGIVCGLNIERWRYAADAPKKRQPALTHSQVLSIRNDYNMGRKKRDELATEHGVHIRTIRRVLERKTYVKV